MSQRAAIARGLANNPTILLLDEPFGALDALTRIQMQKEILKIQKKEGTTMVMVTHDIDEAIVLGNRIVVMSARDQGYHHGHRSGEKPEQRGFYLCEKENL